MSHAKNKVEWCLRKAEKELKESDKHRGLIKINSDVAKAKEYIGKAERYVRATEYLKKGGFSDISTGTVFYAIYHCLQAIAAKHGYESRNQECTFALIQSLIEDEKIDFDKELLNKITVLDVKEPDEKTVTELREQYQYGTEFSIKDKLYKELFEMTKKVISDTKIIIEK